MRKKVIITAALPYANGALHFGHIAGAYLPADCHARYRRAQGDDVLYICGSDEHGIAVTLSAERAGRTPKEQVDHFHGIIRAFFEQLNINFDHYSRTSWEGHREPVQKMFLELLENGYIEQQTTQQLYSPDEERFLADRYVLGTCPRCGYSSARGDECTRCGESYEATDLIDPRSATSGKPLETRESEHWFLMLDRLRDPLRKWISHKQWKPNVQNYAERALEELRPRAITRDLDWGVPVPLEGAEGKVLYVWFDAPIGYLSASQEWAEKIGEPERWRDYWCDPQSELVQFIGKDNLFFHALLFPAMLLGQNQPYKTVDQLPANEFLNLEGRQFSKSEGWTIDLEAFFFRHSSDQIRYTLAANAPESCDSEFTWLEFQRRCNADLVGKLGNLVNRVMTFAHKRCEGAIPDRLELEEADREFLMECQRLAKEVERQYSRFSLRQAAHVLMELAQRGNIYFDQKKPWVDAKSAEARPRMEATIYCCLCCLKWLSLVASPLIPESAQKIWQMLGLEGRIEEQLWKQQLEETLIPGDLGPTEVLFQKVEDEEIERESGKLAGLRATFSAPPLDD